MTAPDRKAKWFKIGVRYDNGRAERVYSIACRCGVEAAYHHNSMSDEGLRKLFARRGWAVGNRHSNHRCPQCLARPKPAPPVPAPELAAPAIEAILRDAMKPPSLEAAWAAASAQERDEFLARMGLTKVFATEAAPEPEPVPPVPEPEPESQDEPDEPADWWIELNSKTAEAA